MNSIKCPQCGLVSWATTGFCNRCGRSFENLPAHAFVSVPASEQAHTQAHAFIGGPPLPLPDPELQRKVWMWYVVFCLLMAGLYLLLTVIGVGFLVLDPGGSSLDSLEMRIRGIAFIIVGPLFMIPFVVAPFLPKRSWNWVYGLVLLIFASLGGCCLWPITLPLIVQWLKPDIKQMFGRT